MRTTTEDQTDIDMDSWLGREIEGQASLTCELSRIKDYSDDGKNTSQGGGVKRAAAENREAESQLSK